MTTINALKKLYVELGGNIKDVENITIIPEMINALSEIAGSTIELPGVTTEDNGDVLTVVDGKWAKAEAGGVPAVTAEDNGDVLTVVEGEWAKATIPRQSIVLTCTKSGGSNYKLPISFSELRSLIDNGIYVVLQVPFTVGSTNFYRNFYLVTYGSSVIFEGMVVANTEPFTITFYELQFANADETQLSSRNMISASV